MANLSNINNKFLVTTGGNVGIGDTGPSTKLTVDAPAVLNNTVNLFKLGDDTNGLVFKKFWDSGGIAWRLNKGISGINMMTFSQGGNVGIGVTSPASKFEVYGGSTGVNDADRYVRFKASNGEKRFDFHIGGTGNASRLDMYQADGATYGARISSSGDSYFLNNFGIGTSSPGVDFQVGDGTTDTSSRFYHSDNTYTQVSGYGLYFSRLASYIRPVFDGTQDLYFGNINATWKTIQFDATTITFDNNSSEAMRIDSSGKVGIGTTSPLANLDITNSAGSVYQQWSYDNSPSSSANNYNLTLSETVTSGNVRFCFNQKNAGTTYSNVLVFNQGNVGIGTDSPIGKTDIFVGASGYTNNVTTLPVGTWSFANGSGGSSYPTLVSKSNATGAGMTLVAATDNGAPNGMDFNIREGDNTDFSTLTTSGFTFSRFGTVLTTILRNGSVGIGVTSPSQKLEVSGNTYVTGYVQASSALIGLKDGYATFGSNSTATGIALSRDFLPSSYPDLIINSSGNVGIGTSSTGYKFEVNGNVKGDSFGTDQNTTARIFAPSGAAYNGSGTQTGYLIIKLPDNGASGVNNMMSGLIRVFDYAGNESFDVHFAGYWYSGYNWTNTTAWIESQSNIDRNFNVRFGAMTGAAGSGTRPYITIGEGNSTWSYCKFSVMEYTSGHSNMNLYKWNSGWEMDLSSTVPGVTARTNTNCQGNNWARNGQDIYYGSGTGAVGIGDSNPSALANRLTIAASGGTGNVVDISTGSTANNNVGAIVFRNSVRSYCGQITVNGATGVTSYLSASDYRLKEDLQDFQGLNLVSNIKVYNYKWKSADERTYGVMAHELQEVLPQAVVGEKDHEEMQSVDYSKIVPLLVKSIQELKAEIELLKSK